MKYFTNSFFFFSSFILGSGTTVEAKGTLRALANKKECTSIEMFSDSPTFGELIQGNAVGITAADVPLFDRNDPTTQLGQFTIFSVDMTNENNPTAETIGFEDGFVRIFEPGTTEEAGLVYYAGKSPSGGDFAITGGTGKYACAEGILKFIAFVDNQFQFDVVLCGETCEP